MTYTGKSQFMFSVQTGLSTPSDYVNDVYNTNLITTPDVSGQLYRDATRLGYNFGARLSINLEGNLYSYVSAGIHRFPQTDIRILKPNTDTLLATISTVQNVIPIEAGCSLYLLKKSLGLYILGGLTYNYITNTTEIKLPNNTPQFPVEKDPTNNRVGFSGGAGIDIDAGILAAGLEVRYNLINFIGRATEEQNKSFITFNLIATFGGRSSK
ncbi:MAG: hypothetical protein IPK11_03545 [Ignavibacteria bacterium]|jgi:opacity protein-like surface antigen|nr:hypothetical protein [Ignavibacteria bacterium]